MTSGNKSLMNNKTHFSLIRLILLMIRHQQIIDKERAEALRPGSALLINGCYDLSLQETKTAGWPVLIIPQTRGITAHLFPATHTHTCDTPGAPQDLCK